MLLKEPVCAVSVCCSYSDFLAESAKWNAHHFDKWVVVTSPDDVETREVCRRNRLHCLVSDDGTRDGEFGKGRLVERGLQQLPADAWIAHLDADIVLPSNFRKALHLAHLEGDTIYGCDRFMVRSWERWQKLVASGWPNSPSWGHPHSVMPPAGYDLGARWAGTDGYVPIGFFQLWHRAAGGEEWRGFRTRPYAVGHGSACREDVQHALQWDRRKRALLPELFVAHLESEQAVVGANWKGRTTKRFGPPLSSLRPSTPS